MVYVIKTTVDTWLKSSTVQGEILPAAQKQFVHAGVTLPLSSFEVSEANHIKLTLGLDSHGKQVQFKGRNTWYVYSPAVQILRHEPVGAGVDNALSSDKYSHRISEKGLQLLKSFEGLKVDAYLDAVGVWTIGYGTTAGVVPGMHITPTQAEALLKRDLAKFENAVIALVKVVLNLDQFSALVMFIYNVGDSALASSTLLRLLNQGDFEGAADQFLRWNQGDKGELPGLTRRRKAERSLFLSQAG